VSELAEVGARMEFVVTKQDSETRDQIVLLSLRRIEARPPSPAAARAPADATAQLERSWSRIAEAQAKDTVYECPVVGVNRGGLLVEVEGIKGFLPSSHLNFKDKDAKLEDMMGKVVRAKVLEADAEGGRLVMSSRRANAESERKAFAPGTVLLGTVQSVMPYGAFVDVDGTSGLLHISQVTNDRLNTLEGVLKVGDKIKVMVLSQDKDKGKLALCTKKLEPSPGDMIKNPQRVFDKAEEMAAAFREKLMLAEKAAAAQ